ncbi:MAG: Clp protease ClpP [Selenomonadaceae bacterium]|nr:Clp protease ClpP [Selenomonadaceae bacterium]
MKKFWNWVRDDGGERVLRLDGPIDEEAFWGTEITPKAFRDELEAEDGDISVWIHSPGGDVFAAAEIYTMLCDYKGKVTVKIDALAASAASVVAMAGDRVLVSPVAMLMIHDPMTIAMGNAEDMEKAIATLNEVKECIINAYQKKTGLSRNKIAKLMSDETWMNARKAVELGFADEIMFTSKGENDDKEIEASWQLYSTKIMGQTILGRLICQTGNHAGAEAEPDDAEDSTESVEPAETGMMADMPEPDVTDGKADKPDSGTETGQTDTPEPAPDVTDAQTDTPDDAQAEPKAPMIGMDGRTPDGAMPYELLRRQLDFLR